MLWVDWENPKVSPLNQLGVEMIEAGHRYPELEREFVSNVCHRSGMITNGKMEAAKKLAGHVESRLDKGAEEYGSTKFWHVPIIGEPSAQGPSLVGELFEETADIFGWGALLSVRLKEKGWTDLVTKLELATTGAVHYGNGLKAIERLIEQRLRR